jgi:hypothetical protein
LHNATKSLADNINQDLAQTLENRVRAILEQSTTLSSKSVASLVNSIKRLNEMDLNNIFSYKPLSKFDEKKCLMLNALKRRSVEAFQPFISHSTKTLCHSMGNPLRAAEDAIEYKDNIAILNLLLKIVNLLSYRFAMAASHAALVGECQYPEVPSFVFDEQNSSFSYRKEIAHMARYYRLHLSSFIATELAIELGAYPRSLYDRNNFESVLKLYEEGCADFIFNFVLYSNKREEKVVTPVLVDIGESKNRKVLGIHIEGDEKIWLWKKWGDPYDKLMRISDAQDRNKIIEITPFSNAMAII